VTGGAPFLTSSYGAAKALLNWGDNAQREAWLPALASGEKIGAVALFDGSGELQPGLQLNGSQLNGFLVTGKLAAVIAAAHADVLIALVSANGKPALALVDLNQAAVTRSVLHTFDNSRGAAALQFNNAQAVVLTGGG